MENSKIDILIADDHPLIRGALKNVLQKHEDFNIVGEAKDGEEAIALAAELEPQVVIMDISMPKVNGLEATRIIKQKNPKIAILILTVYDDEEHIFAVLECGAAGYLTKSIFEEEIVHAVRATAFGETVLSSTVLSTIMDHHTSSLPRPSTGDLIEKLTQRELDILKLAACGVTNKEIAQRLNISSSTVRGYLEQIFGKLNAASRTEAVVTALRAGILNLGDIS